MNQISQLMDRPEKLYLEITNRCNLDCRTCMRNAWEEPLGQMDLPFFQRVIEQFTALAENPTVFIGGIGEPLSHPKIVDMVQFAKRLGCRVEMISNGILLSEGMDHQLMAAGLDCLWVSIDGARPESYSDVRLGDHLPDILENLERWQTLATRHPGKTPELGLSFVAMKRNIADLRQILDLARHLGAQRFSISNVEAYTPELLQEILYPVSVSQDIGPEGVILPRFEEGAVSDTLLEQIKTRFQGPRPETLPAGAACPFHLRKSLSVRWDGLVSPCLPLLHSHTVHFEHYERPWAAFNLGSLHERSLAEIWTGVDYEDLRERLESFNFAPCLSCNGCDLPSVNGEDCYGNFHPACGGCLWAQGFIVCP